MTTEDSSGSPTSLVSRFLRDVDVACPSCQYNLRGSPDERCPECGMGLRLEVAGGSIAAFWWMGAMVGTGIALVLILLTLISQLDLVQQLLGDPRRPMLVAAGMAPASSLPHWPMLVAMASLTAGFGAAFAWLMTARRFLARQTQFARVVIGVVSMTAPVIALGCFRLVLVFLG